MDIIILIILHFDWNLVQVQSSTRYGESRAAYKEVQERHNDIRKIESELVQLAQLFNEVSWMVIHPVLVC